VSPASGGDGPVVARPRELNSGEDRGGAGQRVARTTSLGPSGCAEMVGCLGDRAEGGARRQQQRGGRRSSNSYELAAWPEQHAKRGATGDLSGVRRSTCLRRKAGRCGVHREHHRRRQWRLGVWQGARQRGQLLYRRSCLVEGVMESLHSGLRHGARAVRAAMANSQPGPALRAYGGDAVGWPARRA
jgi:hypothetical protein